MALGYQSPYGSPAYWTNYYFPTSPYYSPYSPAGVQTPNITPAPISPNSPAFQPPPLTSPASPSSPQPIQTPNITPAPISPNSPAFQPPVLSPSTSPASALPVESITVPGAAASPAVQAPSPVFSPVNISPNSPAFASPALSPSTSPPVEAVTVEGTRSPVPHLVQADQLPPFMLTNAMLQSMAQLPYLAPYSPPPQRQQQTSNKSAAGGGGGPQVRPQQQQQQKPLQIVLRQPSAVQQPANSQPLGVPANQMAALANMTPAQLAALLQNPNLTPQQRQAIIDALAAYKNTGRNVNPYATGAGAAGSPANKQAAGGAAAPAVPFSPVSFVIPLLVAAGVVVAYQVTHHHGPAIVRHARRIRRQLGSLAHG